MLRGLIVQNYREQQFFDILFNTYFNGSIDKALEEFRKETEIKPDNSPNRIGLQLFLPQISNEQLMSIESNYKLALKKLSESGYQESADHILLRYILPSSNSMEDLLFRRQVVLDELRSQISKFYPKEIGTIMSYLAESLDKSIQNFFKESSHWDVHSKFKSKGIESQPIIEIKDTPELHQALVKLGRRLAVKVKRKSTKGENRIDFRQTFRKNIKHGGILVEPHLKKKRKEKPKLLVLTDVSPSTIHATKMFVTIVAQIKELFSNVRFFEFIGSCIEVSEYFHKANSVPDAVKGVIEAWNTVALGKQSSDYERAFKDFNHLLKDSYISNHTVIILGDLRDWLGSWENNRPKCTTILQDIKTRVKNVVVFNPENKQQWNKGDSIVTYVEDLGISVLESSNLEDLVNNLETIF
jgi:uncharacterized protein with von Willebrand factor type A (vWA) domain